MKNITTNKKDYIILTTIYAISVIASFFLVGNN